MTPASVDPVFLHLQALVAGRFSLEREIGRGGMGVVYLARDVALERPVAIKVLSPSLAARPEMRERFLREARLAAQCFHPHIVPIHAVESADDLAWIVMAYVRGETLSERLRRSGPLPAEEVRRLAREVGWALSYAHQRGVVHRDIKPENLLIDASTGRYVIADFGIAQGGDHVSTPLGGTVPGTARYMAPEQALGEFIDGRADLYALGVTLFVAATGRAPFEGDNALALVAQHAAQPAPSVRTRAPDMPLSLARAIDRCLAKRPDDRFPDAGAFLGAIEPDAREQPLATMLHAVRDHARAARTMLWWSGIVSVTTTLLVLGENRGSIGRGVLESVGQSVVMMFLAAAALRAGEALIEARKQLRLGQSRDDVSRAMAHDDTPSMSGPAASRGIRSGVTQLLTGAALALAQGRLDELPIPGLLGDLLEVSALLLPPMLLARGAGMVFTSVGARKWIRERVTTPIARFATAILGRGISPAREEAALADAPTEVLLVRAVESAVHALPAAHKASMVDADAIARALAQQAGMLRAQGQQLDAREAAALVLRDSAERQAELDAVRADRVANQSRLQTAMAALESLRLDVLQLTVDRSDSGITAQLEQVRDVQRRVDAAMDVRRMLHQATPT